MRAPRSDSGFTLVEVLVVMVLLGMLGGITTAVVTRGRTVTTDLQARVVSQAQLNDAVNRVSGAIQSGATVTVATPTELVLTHENQDTGVCAMTRYTVTGDTFTSSRSTGCLATDAWLPTIPVVRGIDPGSRPFTYYVEPEITEEFPADPATIERVAVSLTVGQLSLFSSATTWRHAPIHWSNETEG